jgi:spore coat protein U-like protein
MTMLTSLTVLAALLAADPAFAGCQVTLTGVSFGSVSPSTRTDSTGRVRVDCDQPLAYMIGIAPGPGGGERRMVGPGNATLRYDLYIDPGRNFPWGDGSALGDALGGASDGKQPDSYTIYGAVPAQPRALPGDYVDATMVTLSF